MATAGNSDTVTVHYIGTLDNGRIFDSTQDREPLVFTIGSGEVFPALERAVTGMTVGETKNVLLPAAEAFGPRKQENIIRIERSALPAGQPVTVGRRLSIEFSGGESRVMTVIGVTDSDVTLDGNHPLAGRDLTFALRLDAIA